MTTSRSPNLLRTGSWTALAALLATGIAGTVFAAQFGDFSTPVSAEAGSDSALNTPATDGCPILSPDGLSLYMASNRPGGMGGLDIWVARRTATTDGWGAPVNLGAPVNSTDNEFCPTPVRGRGLFFVRAPFAPPPGGMVGDIFRSRLDSDGWREPERLPETINSSAQEWSPAYFEDEAGNEVLYFSSTRTGRQAIFASVNYGPATPVAELNANGDAARPNVRKDGREIVFDSTRSPNFGGPDIWIARRGSTGEPWGAPERVAEVSSTGADTRASLSWDGTFLLVGSTRQGSEIGANGLPSTDIYVSTRPRLTGQ